jgi:choriolysin H
MYYYFLPADVQRQVIASAINEYHTNTCIRFAPRINEPDYVTFVTNPVYGRYRNYIFYYITLIYKKINDFLYSSCYSQGLGRQGGPQVVSLSDDCVCLAEQNCEYLGVYVVQHELMHVLGWFHEQSRYDRDDYVIINWDNIDPSKLDYYNLHSKASFLYIFYLQ